MKYTSITKRGRSHFQLDFDTEHDWFCEIDSMKNPKANWSMLIESESGEIKGKYEPLP